MAKRKRKNNRKSHVARNKPRGGRGRFTGPLDIRVGGALDLRGLQRPMMQFGNAALGRVSQLHNEKLRVERKIFELKQNSALGELSEKQREDLNRLNAERAQLEKDNRKAQRNQQKKWRENTDSIEDTEIRRRKELLDKSIADAEEHAKRATSWQGFSPSTPTATWAGGGPIPPPPPPPMPWAGPIGHPGVRTRHSKPSRGRARAKKNRYEADYSSYMKGRP